MTSPTGHPRHQDADHSEPLALAVEPMTKTYGATTALHDVQLSVRTGRVHALLGANGSGKSTLIKILAGVTQASSGGRIYVGSRSVAATAITPAAAKDLGMRFVHQQLGLFPGLSLTENVAAATGFPVAGLATIPWRELNRRTAALLGEFGIDARPADRVDSLRPSTRTLLAIARAMGPDPQSRLLILDEPTASLPEADARHLLDAVRTLTERGITTLIVTHRLGEVAAIADDITVLRDGSVVADGPADDFPHATLVECISPGARSQREQAVSEQHQGRAADRQLDGELRIEQLQAAGVHGLDLQVHAGEIIGLAGLAGSGRTALLETLFGVRRVHAGQVTLGGTPVSFRSPADAIRAGVALVPEDRARQAVFSEQALSHNVTAATLGRFFSRGSLQRRAEGQHAQTRIREFGIKAASGHVPISTLSGSNQQKAVLARWLDINPRVLLLDEPTQGVDVGARADIHQVVRAVAAQGACVLLVSSDLEEMSELSDRIVLLVRGRLEAELPAPFTAETVGQRMHALA